MSGRLAGGSVRLSGISASAGVSGRLAGGCVRMSGVSASAWVRGRFAGGGSGARFSLKVITTNGSGSEESGLSRRNGNYTASVLLLRNELVVLHICVSACY